MTGIFATAAAFSAKPTGMRTARVAAEFAPTLVPIVVGYFVAHYWSLLVIGGQQTFIFMSDPLSNGDNWLGLSHRSTDYTLAQPRLVALLQVTSIVVGHVLGVLTRTREGVAADAGQASRQGAAAHVDRDGVLHDHRAVPVVQQLTHGRPDGSGRGPFAGRTVEVVTRSMIHAT